jgi:selenocysteine lyase/cysteine desulfurase
MTPEEFRGRFPSLGRRVHFASCSLGARSVDLDEAMHQMLEDMADGGAPWHLFEERVAEARDRFAAFVGARVDQVALLPDASTGAYQVASTMDWTARPGIVTSTLEFPSVAHVWLAQRPRGAEVRHAGDATDYLGLLDERTRLVSVPLVTYQDSLRMPVEEVAAAAHATGARVFVDAYQAGVTGRVDVAELGCDYLVMGTMKYLLGLPGLCFLYVRDPEVIDRLPQLTGWFGRVNPFAFDPTELDFATGADRFRTGTPGVPAAYAACAGLRLVGALDPDAVREHVHGLADLAAARLRAQGELVDLPPRERRGAHIGLRDPDPAALGRALAERGIAVGPRGPVARISFHYYNNSDDVAALCSALAAIRGRAHRPADRRASGEDLCVPTS